MIFFSQKTTNKILMYLSSAPLILQNFNILQTIQSYEDAPYLGPKWSICPKQKIFWKILLISLSSAYWPLSLCKIFKKLSHQIQSYHDALFLGPKWPICPNNNFFRKSVNKHCSFHLCLSTCQNSNSDDNLLMKYLTIKEY